MAHQIVSRRTLLSGAGAAVVGLSVPSLSSAASAGGPATRPRVPMRLLTRHGLPKTTIERIAAISPEITVISRARDQQWAEELPQADAIYGHVSGEDVAAAGRLRWVQYNAAGVEHVLSPQLVASAVKLTNARGCHAAQIAEHVFALLFGLTRNIAAYARSQQRIPRPTELRGLTMGIVGLGSIGRETARRAKAMDMRVLAIDEQPMFVESLRLADEIHSPDWLGEMLKSTDVLVIAAPHTPRSQGMIGEAQFALMKPSAVLINVSRGKLVKTDALLAALKEKRLAGAGLDVTDPEPLPPDHALWELPNVIVTPHIAGQSQFTEQRVQDVLMENVRRYVNALPLINLVDKQAGY
ncbi:MAG TPA: D-2-hydroxyacid dehydrogenase [Tepidisphaeraceae bacterium]|nr:D-2-hydroxyacid dehydrogenase [Tepidisphaeraceae bacterium]